MASNGTGHRSGSALSLVDDSFIGCSACADTVALRLVRDVEGGAEDALAVAGAAMARVEREMHHLWRHAMKANARGTSHRLAEVSQALHRAARQLDQDGAIG
jgi:hypothetical protein